MSGTSEKQSWMYSGPESTVDREAYLLGRKLDKNFELYGTDKSKEKEGGIARLHSGSRLTDSKARRLTTELEVETVRKEDPLVAIKLREAQARQELIANPVKMKKLQGLVMEAMEKKMAKALRKAAKKERKEAKRERKERKEAKRRPQPSPKRRRRHSSPDTPPRRRRRSSSPRRHRSSHQRRPSPSRRHSPPPSTSPTQPSSSSSAMVKTEPKASSSATVKTEPKSPPQRERHDSSSSSSSSDGETKGKPRPGPYLPSNLGGSDSEEEERRAKAAKFSGFGLVTAEGKKVKVEKKSSRRVEALPDLGSIDRKRLEPARSKVAASAPREKLSQEEMDQRRKEMAANAEWREEQRATNLSKYKALERKEEEEERRHKTGGFVKAVHASAVASGDLASRINQNKQKIQRTEAAFNANSFRR